MEPKENIEIVDQNEIKNKELHLRVADNAAELYPIIQKTNQDRTLRGSMYDRNRGIVSGLAIPDPENA